MARSPELKMALDRCEKWLWYVLAVGFFSGLYSASSWLQLVIAHYHELPAMALLCLLNIMMMPSTYAMCCAGAWALWANVTYFLVAINVLALDFYTPWTSRNAMEAASRK